MTACESHVAETGDFLPQHGYSAISSSANGQSALAMLSAEVGADSLGTETSNVSYGYWYSKDGTELLACIVFFVACSLVRLVKNYFGSVVSHQRPIPYQLLSSGEYVRNLAFNEIFQGDTVSDGLLVVLGMLVPFAVQYTIGTLFLKHEAGNPHATMCVYLVAFGIAFVSTDLLKSYCGYLRPVFYDLCKPDEDSFTTCSNTNAEQGARRSFPSGHASISFCGLTLLTLFLHSRFGVPSLQREIDRRREYQMKRHFNEEMDPVASMATNHDNGTSTNTFRVRCLSILAMAPIGLALFIAASRVVDNRHFPADVVGGSLLGASIANFVHGLWF